MARLLSQLALTLAFFSLPTRAANRDGFRTCSTSPFCRRYRTFVNFHHKLPGWHVVQDVSDQNAIKFDLQNQGYADKNFSDTHLTASLTFTKIGAFRLVIEEKNVTQAQERYKLSNEDVLVEYDKLQVPPTSFVETKKTDEGISITFNVSAIRTDIHVNFKPFQMKIEYNGRLHSIVNAQNYLNFEVPRENEPLVNHTRDATAVDNHDLFSYYFGGSADKIKQGPRAVGIDISYCDVKGMYGLAEHTSRFDLSDTFPHTSDFEEPYRFWNSDVFAYELDSPMGLYASIPLLHTAHESGYNTGTLWLNAAETFVKLDRNRTNVQSDDLCTMTPTWWVSETGALDVLFMGGSSQTQVVQKYHSLTGPIAMQQMNTLGLHQCRWNYESQEDVAYVNEMYDRAEMPVDYIWLDIDHTSHRKYFTWDSDKFSDPQAMLNNLASHKRNMVLIVDPHIKSETGYQVHEAFKKKNYYVKEESGDDFRGWCWPGDSSYPDLMRPEVRALYKDWFKSSFWNGTAPSPKAHLPPTELKHWLSTVSDLQIWNDMNEPSVFNKPEVTIPRAVTHYGGRVEHRSVHNLYGLQFHRSSYEAVQQRGDKVRPFVLTRSAFIGSHRYGPIWTGDNTASWEHARASIPMLLSLSLCGMSNSGADVGGFFEEPSIDLALRWTQAGAWYPFFRVHSTQGSTRRELYLLPEPERSSVRQALLMRYKLLPFWYTLMATSVRTGSPMMNSILDFEQRFKKGQIDSYQRDDGFLLGDAIFVRPNLWPSEEINLTASSFVMPGDPSVSWFDLWNSRTPPVSGGAIYRDVHAYEKTSPTPVFVRAGTILPMKMQRRRSSEAMRADPFTLTLYYNSAMKSAEGQLYLDDYRSMTSPHVWINFHLKAFDESRHILNLTSNQTGKLQSWQLNTQVERLVLIGMKNIKRAERVSETGARIPLILRKRHDDEIEIKLDKEATLLTVNGSLLSNAAWTVLIYN